MLRIVVLGLLTLSAACATTALAHGDETHDYRGHGQSLQTYDDSRSTDFSRWCRHHRRCSRLEDHNARNQEGDHSAAAPEIDPAGAISALTLLAGALSVMRRRRAPEESA